MKRRVTQITAIASIAMLVFVATINFFTYSNVARAASLTQAYVRLDRLKTATPTSGLVCARPTTSTTTNVDVAVTFPTVAVTDYTVSPTTTNWTGSTGSIPAGTTAWPGITSATIAVVGHMVTWTYTAQTLNVGTTYCFNWANTAALTTSASGINQIGTIALHNTGPTLTDSSQYALSVIANDQVSITGTINPTFSFSLSQTSTSFSTIGNSVVDASPLPAVSITTNARNGYTAWVKDANNGTLNSAGTGANIPIPGSVGGASYNLATMTGPGAFGLGVTVSGGGATADAAYNGATTAYAGTLSNAFRPMASSTTYASNDTITLIPRAIASTTQAPASDYTDTLTVVAAGQF